MLSLLWMVIGLFVLAYGVQLIMQTARLIDGYDFRNRGEFLRSLSPLYIPRLAVARFWRLAK